MAHGLASQLGGALTIESQLGKGAQISIWLPQCLDTLTSANEPQPISGAPTQAGFVLLVDDEAHIRSITSEMLTELGFRVHDVATPEDALAALDAGLELDVLITDHLMPGMTGVELAHAVQARCPGARTLIISGFAEVDSLDAALPRLTKPFVQQELAAALAEILSVQAEAK